MVQGAREGYHHKIFSDIPAYRRAGLSDHGTFEKKTERLPRNLFFGLLCNSLYNKIMELMDKWVKAGTIENRFEGDRISQALQEAGISFLIKSFLDTAYNGLYIPQKGWGIVMVSGKNKEEAERLISEIKKTFKEEEEDETGQLG